MKYAALLALALLTACESDEAKLDRLQTAAFRARMELRKVERHVEEGGGVAVVARSARHRDLLDSLQVAQDGVLLAERDLNRFLR